MRLGGRLPFQASCIGYCSRRILGASNSWKHFHFVPLGPNSPSVRSMASLSHGPVSPRHSMGQWSGAAMCWLLFPSQTSLKVDYTLKKTLNHCPLSTETALGFPTLPTYHPASYSQWLVYFHSGIARISGLAWTTA